MIDIKKLTTFLNKNYIDPESAEGKREIPLSHKNSPLLDFARKISGRGGMKPLHAMSPVKRPDFQKVKEKLNESDNEDDLSRRIFYYMNKKGKTRPQVYKAAGMEPGCFSKIVSKKTKTPTRENMMALAFALELNLEEAQDLLSRAGYSFPVPTIKEDVIFQYCFEDKDGPHTIDEVNEALCHFGFKAIGGRN